MHFLSSKLVHELQTAFANILDHQKVKEGQLQLQKLRKERQFELALATFISRSQDYHKRLLAVLQLQKIKIIEEMQTVWSLKQVYFKDRDKIAQKICKIITLKQNIKMASEFLVVDTHLTGIIVYRQIQIVFNLLRVEDKARCTNQFHFGILSQYFIDALTIIQNNQPCFFMFIVSFALFCLSTLKFHSSYQQEIYSLWKQVENKWRLSQIDGVFLVYYLVKKIIFNQSIEYRQNTLHSYLNTILSKRSHINMKYYSKCLQIIGKQGIVLQNQNVRNEFIKSILEHNRDRNRQMLLNIKIYGNKSMQVQDQAINQDNNQLSIRQTCNRFIKLIFSQYYQWLSQSFLNKHTIIASIQILLALINYYNSPQLPNLKELFPNLFHQIIKQLDNYLNSSNLNNQQRNICITFIVFLTKYKAQVQLCQLPNIVNLLSKVSETCPILSPFCDAFLSQVWKELTYLQLNQLVSFFQFHLQKINENQWAICFERYECFLRLALYLQQSNNYFSNCTENDSLLTTVLKSHSIICQYLAVNGQKIDFQIFHLFLTLTKSIIENNQFRRDKAMYNRLSVPFLIDRIEKHLFLNEDTAIIVAFHRYHKQTLAECLYQQSAKWEIDQLDYNYRIALYLAEIQLARQLIPQIQLKTMKTQLGNKIIQFIKTVSCSQLQKLRQAKIWDKLQGIYGIGKYIAEQMDIQSI